MNIEGCIKVTIEAFKDEEIISEDEVKQFLKEILHHRAKYEIDFRTIRGKSILHQVKDGLNLK